MILLLWLWLPLLVVPVLTKMKDMKLAAISLNRQARFLIILQLLCDPVSRMPGSGAP